MAGEMEDLGAVITTQQFSSIKTHSAEIFILYCIDFLSDWRFFHREGGTITELLIRRQSIYRRRLYLSFSLCCNKFSVFHALLFAFQSFRWTIFIYLKGRKIWDHTVIVFISKHITAVLTCRKISFSTMNPTGEGTEFQQAYAQLRIRHWLARSSWSSHFLHIPQYHNTDRVAQISCHRNKLIYGNCMKHLCHMQVLQETAQEKKK